MGCLKKALLALLASSGYGLPSWSWDTVQTYVHCIAPCVHSARPATEGAAS